jgi:hypothetical protein
MSTNVVTPEFRVSYPNVHKPKKNELNGKEEYSVVALFSKSTDLTALKELVYKTIVEKWGPDKAKWPTNSEGRPLRTPFRKQDDRMKDGVLPSGYEAGAFYLNLKSEQKPGLVDQNLQPILDPSEFYGGCFARASIRAFAYDQKGNRGVSFSLGNLQKTRDGDPFGNRTRPEQDFVAIEGAAKSASSADELFD